MGRAELLLVLGALVIFGRFSLIVNNSLLESSTRVLESEFEITAVSLLQEIIYEAGLQAFDSASVNTIPASVPGGFTPAGALGSESGETYPDFNDVDDYDGITITDSTIAGMDYTITTDVGYVTAGDLVTFSSTQTTMKRMNLTLSSVYLTNDINLSYVFAFIRE